MTRRLTLAIVGTVVATLVLVGTGTLALARLGARDATRGELAEDVETIGGLLNFATLLREPDGGRPLVTRDNLEEIAAELHLADINLLFLDPSGAPLPITSQLTQDGVGGIPPGVALEDLETDRLVAGDVVSGYHGSLVYAATRLEPRRSATIGDGPKLVPAVVITRQADARLGRAAGWFMVAGALTVGIGVIVANVMGRGLTRPLREASAAAHRIADGDFDARVPEPRRGDDELGRLSSSVNHMAASLERSRGLERQFLLSVSHDLRTPLTSIRGYAEAIADGAAADPVEAAGIIRSESRRLERLVGDLLDLAKLDARRFGLHLARIDATEVVVDTVEGFRREAERHGIVLEAPDESLRHMVVADPDRLAQITANLVENALKFATHRVVVTATSVPGAVEIIVADDGPGIADEDKPHVFERLYQTHERPRRKESGSGLGLAIVRELVAAMGGTVTVGDTPGGGASMTVRLLTDELVHR